MANCDNVTKRCVPHGTNLIIKFKGVEIDNAANAANDKYNGNKKKNECKGNKFKEDHPVWVPAHSYDYCDKKPETKDPKGRDERAERCKAKQENMYGLSGSS